jgi:hypothetical protein
MTIVTDHDAPAITAPDDAERLSDLAWDAAQAARRLFVAAQALSGAARGAQYPGQAARAFGALRSFQAALDDADRHAGAVVSHAVTRHGYY